VPQIRLLVLFIHSKVFIWLLIAAFVFGIQVTSVFLILIFNSAFYGRAKDFAIICFVECGTWEAAVLGFGN
jgi:hypothetical protein